MAKTSRKKSRRGDDAEKGKMSMATRRVNKSASGRGSTSSRQSGQLDEISDAPESGEPREQGRSRGRMIDTERAEKILSQGSVARKGRRPSAKTARSNPKGPLAAQLRDESGDTANEAWESGRQKAMD